MGESLVNACREKGLGLTWPEDTTYKPVLLVMSSIGLDSSTSSIQGYNNPAFNISQESTAIDCKY